MTTDKIDSIAQILIKTEMNKRFISYKELSEKLKKYEYNLTPESLETKLYRKGFSASFFFTCMLTLGVNNIDMSAFEEKE